MMTPKDHYARRYHLQVAPSPHNYWLYGYLQGLGDVRSVFEFGANAGRHLHQLRRVGIEVAGLDINPRAVEAAALHFDLHTIRLGDEDNLANYASGSFDVAMTVSVLCHMEDPSEVFRQLERIAAKHVVLVETRSRTDHGSYWWSHNYPGDPVYSYYAPQVNAVYQVWHVRKS